MPVIERKAPAPGRSALRTQGQGQGTQKTAVSPNQAMSRVLRRVREHGFSLHVANGAAGSGVRTEEPGASAQRVTDLAAVVHLHDNNIVAITSKVRAKPQITSRREAKYSSTTHERRSSRRLGAIDDC